MNPSVQHLTTACGISLRVTGDDDGQALLLVHPIAANLTFWDDFIAALGSRFRCVAYDQRGFGASPAPSRPWTLDDHVEDVERVRQRAGLDRFAIAGTAVANIIALHYVHRHPERIDAAIVANPSRGQIPARSRARLELVSAAGTLRAIAEDAVAQAYGALPHDRRYERYRDDIFSTGDPVGYRMTVEGLLDASAAAILPDIACPTLVIAGALDLINPPHIVAVEMAGSLPNSRFQTVSNASHFGPYQAPQEFAALTASFLQSQS